VKAGDPIIELDLDLVAKQKADQAYASYQSAKNSLDAARVKLYTLRVDLLTTWDEFKQLAETGKYSNADQTPKNDARTLPEFYESQDTWLASEATYKNQQNIINQAQTSLNSSWFSYQQTSPTVYAPISGTVSGLSLQEGSVIVASQTDSSTSVTSTKVASVTTKGLPMISVSLTEIDAPKITLGNKATALIDALTGKTFTGTVTSIDKVGVVSSGVTTYPTVITLDSDVLSILPNMAASVTIITEKKDDVLLVPTSAVQTQNGSSSVRVLQKGVPVSMAVETGLTSDTETEIIGGIAEGDTVVTGTVANGTSTKTTGTSLFGVGNRGGGAQIHP
jgi:HlyD family secretion protein